MNDRKLSPNFWLSELTVTQQRGLDNTPDPAALGNLERLAATMERVRDVLGGHPIYITSGYRSVEVNRAVGGSPSSEHMSGRAVDFTCPAFGTPLAVCHHLQHAAVNYNQLIHEWRRWTHLSIPQLGMPPRLQECRMDERGWAASDQPGWTGFA